MKNICRNSSWELTDEGEYWLNTDEANESDIGQIAVLAKNTYETIIIITLSYTHSIWIRLIGSVKSVMMIVIRL
jgi:hypothetical protein